MHNTIAFMCWGTVPVLQLLQKVRTKREDKELCCREEGRSKEKKSFAFLEWLWHNHNNLEIIIFVISQHNFLQFYTQRHFPFPAVRLNKRFCSCYYCSMKQSNVGWTNSINTRISLRNAWRLAFSLLFPNMIQPYLFITTFFLMFCCKVPWCWGIVRTNTAIWLKTNSFSLSYYPEPITVVLECIREAI